MTKKLYERIRRKHGGVASWAIWETQGDRPKSNMSPDKIFNLNTNPSLLESLNSNVVMAGLNFSREVGMIQDFANFHDESPSANDFKIRYAFSNTPYYGAYMTDVLKEPCDLGGERRSPLFKRKSERFAISHQPL